MTPRWEAVGRAIRALSSSETDNRTKCGRPMAWEAVAGPGRPWVAESGRPCEALFP